jgi:hypothetical protein
MPRVVTIVPAETDLLCEGCGYTLNGLPHTGNCPECGRPITQSLGGHRELSSFEWNPSVRTFLLTSLSIWFSPAQFYSSLTTRGDTRESLFFARVHRGVAAILLAVAFVGHALWLIVTMVRPPALDPLRFLFPGFVVAVLMYAILVGVTALAAWLSALEARYWGMRLPQPIVVRGLKFHSACYLPVGVLAVAIVWGHQYLLSKRLLLDTSASWYLYTLCGAVVISAVYLFIMYWVAMKNMMYANR